MEQEGATVSMYYDGLRAEFLRLLTTDGDTQDRRRAGFNQAIFAPEEEGGYAVYNHTTLDMVMLTFDKAVRSLGRQ